MAEFTGISALGDAMMEVIAGQRAKEAAMRELQLRVGLPLLMQQQEKEKDRQQKLEELRIRYDEERQARKENNQLRMDLQAMIEQNRRDIATATNEMKRELEGLRTRGVVDPNEALRMGGYLESGYAKFSEHDQEVLSTAEKIHSWISRKPERKEKASAAWEPFKKFEKDNPNATLSDWFDEFGITPSEYKEALVNKELSQEAQNASSWFITNMSNKDQDTAAKGFGEADKELSRIQDKLKAAVGNTVGYEMDLTPEDAVAWRNLPLVVSPEKYYDPNTIDEFQSGELGADNTTEEVDELDAAIMNFFPARK